MATALPLAHIMEMEIEVVVPPVLSPLELSVEVKITPQELEDFARSHNRPWLAMGDFNDTRFLQERSGDSDCMRQRCNKFNAWFETNNWIDLNYSGPIHTCSRGHSADSSKWARLDRAICNSSWRVMFAEGSIRHLVANQSDHCSIIFNTNGFAPIPSILRPLWFQATWMCHAKFSESIAHNWNNELPLIPFINSFVEKLQTWNKAVFRNIFERKKSLERRLLGVQRKLLYRGTDFLEI
ncbi:uncharacterized protein LOC141620132 [Silene latifolia]|uniref:uncharacterized protein LOC141620132 n=1 Tax=Silene latifolia TaxID=37657 RepID=UPI003D78A572